MEGNKGGLPDNTKLHLGVSTANLPIVVRKSAIAYNFTLDLNSIWDLLLIAWTPCLFSQF